MEGIKSVSEFLENLDISVIILSSSRASIKFSRHLIGVLILLIQRRIDNSGLRSDERGIPFPRAGLLMDSFVF